jgi:glyceraldehyde 3-phosphate dehydrogenase
MISPILVVLDMDTVQSYLPTIWKTDNTCNTCRKERFEGGCMARIAINGFGRIGRAAFKIALDAPELEVVAINDLIPLENLVYLLRFDTAYGRYSKTVGTKGQAMTIDGKEHKVFNKKDPEELPWRDLGIDIVLECTGKFADAEGMRKHAKAGARHVILSAAAKSGEVAMVIPGVSGHDGKPTLISCASCTTNCITPIIEILGRRVGIQKAIMTTVHAYTASQGLIDGPARSVRRGRAAACNLVPTSTGAATATTRVLPEYEGKFHGIAIRAPIPVGSIADVILLVSRKTTVEEVNAIFSEEAESERYRGILGVSNDELVSSDIVGDSRASIVDLKMTQVVDGDLVKVMSWYDNEWGYAHQLIREAVAIAKA